MDVPTEGRDDILSGYVAPILDIVTCSRGLEMKFGESEKTSVLYPLIPGSLRLD
jgi:hypothetical protein